MYFYYIIFFLLFLFFLLSVEETDKRILFVFTCVLFIVIAAFRSPNTDRDYLTYVSYIKTIGDLHLIQLEPTFFLITYISLHTPYPIFLLFFIYAILGIGLKFKAISELTEFWFLSLLIYFSYYFLIHDMTQIRVGVGSAILLLSIKDIYNRNIVSFLIKIVIGALFHYSFLIFVFFYFIDPNKIKVAFFYILILVAYIVYYSGFNILLLFRIIPINFIQVKMESYRQLMEQDHNVDINVLNILMIYRIVYMFILLWKAELLQAANKYSIILIKIYSWGLFCLVFLASMPVLAFRVNQLLCIVEIILWPFILYLVKEKYIAIVLIVITGLAMLTIELFYNHLLNGYFN